MPSLIPFRRIVPLLVSFGLTAGGCGRINSDSLPESVIKQKVKEALFTRYDRPYDSYGKMELRLASSEILEIQQGELLDGSGLVNVPPGTKRHPIRIRASITCQQPAERQKEIRENKFDVPILQRPVKAEGEIEAILYKDAYGDWQLQLCDFRNLDKNLKDSVDVEYGW